MAVTNWDITVTKQHFNNDNVRDPTIVFNNVSIPYGTCPGYDNTKYAVTPINFAPNINAPKASVWTPILLDQFNVPACAKIAILTGNNGILGPNMWTGIVYAWFRKPGSTWALSPIFDGGYRGSFCVHVPIGLIDGVPAIEMAWGTNGLDTTNWGTGLPVIDHVDLNIILTSWGE